MYCTVKHSQLFFCGWCVKQYLRFTATGGTSLKLNPLVHINADCNFSYTHQVTPYSMEY